jgi:hypothetical protein
MEKVINMPTNKPVIVARAINGITINGLEYLLDNDREVIVFSTKAKARQFLIDNGLTSREIRSVQFLDAKNEGLVK